jgi:methyltransferase (TIGR00027 family)
MPLKIAAGSRLACIAEDGHMHVDSPASRTALGAARHRAVHQLLEGGVVFRDPLALPVLGESETDLRARADDRRMRFFVCARQRYAEDVLADAVDRGVDQLVVLGAGLDTFGYRNPYPGLRVVELDHPATQAWKRERLEAASIEVPASVDHAPIDFERDDLTTVLARHIDPARPVLFWWLGVTPYLTLEAITATLTSLGSLPHSAVVLDHSAPSPDATAEARTRTQSRRDRVAALGEPWISQFVPDDLARLLISCGFEHAHLEDEVALVHRVLQRPSATEPPAPRVTHLALATTGWPGGSDEVAQAARS